MQMSKVMRPAALALVFLAAGLTLRGTAEEKKADKKGLTDQEFVVAASAAGLAEVNLSTLALDRATKADVKEFAKHMVDDHTKNNTELLQIANTKRLLPAPKMDAKHQALADDLSKLKGAEFDRAYMKAMVKDHEDAVVLFGAAHISVEDKDLKAYASKTLPVVKAHLEMAKKMSGDTKDPTKDPTKDIK